jgi:hypothetical protein
MIPRLDTPDISLNPITPKVTSEIQKGFYKMGYSITLNPITLLQEESNLWGITKDSGKQCGLTSCHICPERTPNPLPPGIAQGRARQETGGKYQRYHDVK